MKMYLTVESKCTHEFETYKRHSLWLITGDGREEERIEVEVSETEYAAIKPGSLLLFDLVLDTPAY